MTDKREEMNKLNYDYKLSLSVNQMPMVKYNETIQKLNVLSDLVSKYDNGSTMMDEISSIKLNLYYERMVICEPL